MPISPPKQSARREPAPADDCRAHTHAVIGEGQGSVEPQIWAGMEYEVYAQLQVARSCGLEHNDRAVDAYASKFGCTKKTEPIFLFSVAPVAEDS